MESYTMFLDWKNRYFENDYTTQIKLQIQCNPYQTTNGHVWYQYQNLVLTELEQRISQFTHKYQRPQIAKTILRKKNGAGGIRLPDFRIHNKATVIRTVWYWQKKRNTHQWNRIESSDINVNPYGHLVLDKGGKNIKWRKDSVFYDWCWGNWTATHTIMKLTTP